MIAESPVFRPHTREFHRFFIRHLDEFSSDSEEKAKKLQYSICIILNLVKMRKLNHKLLREMSKGNRTRKKLEKIGKLSLLQKPQREIYAILCHRELRRIKVLRNSPATAQSLSVRKCTASA
jgi:ParB-like chromosome segregation protein Spo0J